MSDSVPQYEHAFVSPAATQQVKPPSPSVRSVEGGIDGGYDVGYASSDCFWGTEPGSLVRRHYRARRLQGQRILDLGCGEGKNAAYLASLGASVDAVDCSSFALRNGRSRWGTETISWHLCDARDFLNDSSDLYDSVIMYGLLHCLGDRDEVSDLVAAAQRTTRPGGTHIVCAFNDRDHDLRAHPGFSPTLLPHAYYVQLYSAWNISQVTDADLWERHPHNEIDHHHSLTRLVAHAGH